MGLLGYPFNILSAVFFLRNKIKNIPHRLLTMLSLVDQVTILGCLVGALYEESQRDEILSRILYFMTLFCCLTSGFITSVLATTRGIAISLPFYVIRSTMLFRIMTVIIAIITAQTAIKAYYFSDDGFGAAGHILFVILAIEFNIFLLCSMISGIIILHSICFREHVQCRDEGDKARQRKTLRNFTITILLITGAAMICNTTVVICFVLMIVFEDIELPMELVNIALCLNSGINPLLYITRNRDIRTFECLQTQMHML